MNERPEYAEVEVLPPEKGKTSVAGKDPLMQMVAHLMDNAFVIPGTKIRFGLDPLLGLIPGLGDTASAVVSFLTLMQCARRGLPRIVLARMAGNILLNTVIGAIPVLGDVFSVWFKSNQRNLVLLEKHLENNKTSTAADWLFVILLLVVLAVVTLTVVAAIVYLLGKLFGAFK